MKISEFKSRWLECFAEGIPKNKIKRYVVATGNFIWHIFSWELLPEGSYLEGDAARKAYDAIDKKGSVYLEPFAEEDPAPVTSEHTSSKQLDKLCEIYVVGKDFEWTYIKTHEDRCGPYFCKKQPYAPYQSKDLS